MARMLVIDLDACEACERCGVRCGDAADSSAHLGAIALRERATYAVVCRRCEEPSCIDACPFDALRRSEKGVLERLALRCVSCKLCVHSCPFGTIYPDMVPFYSVPCAACLESGDGPPPCAGTCDRGAIEYVEVDPRDPELHIVGERLAARARRWTKQERRL